MSPGRDSRTFSFGAIRKRQLCGDVGGGSNNQEEIDMTRDMELAKSNAVAAVSEDARGDCAARNRLRFEAVVTYGWCTQKQWAAMYKKSCAGV